MTLLFPLFLVPAAVCAVAAFVVRTSSLRDDWKRVLDGRVLAALLPTSTHSRFNVSFLALAVVLTALASPSIRAETENSHALNEGIIVLMDLSKSMTVADIGIDRLTLARSAALAISKGADARPLALIVYAGDAYLAQPFSLDRRAFDTFVNSLDRGLIPQEGSLPARALSLAASVLEQSGVGRARIIILSDGGGFGAQTTEIAARIAAHGHTLDAIAFAPSKASMPVAADFAAFRATIDAAGGVLANLDANGNANLAALDLAVPFFGDRGLTQLALRSTEWRNISHYLLLLALWPMLLMFRETRR